MQTPNSTIAHKVIFVLGLLFFISLSVQAQFRVIGYLPVWMNYPNSINSVDLTKVTHINIAFANPNATGTLTGAGTTGNIATVVNACHAQNVKVFISIGGAGAPGATYAGLINNATNINNFVTKIMTFVTTNNLDGVDVDIEGDILDGSTLTSAQYQAFVIALGNALHAQGKLMSAALATWFATYVTNTAAAQYDWINLMSYDATGPWDPGTPGQHSPYSLATSDFTYWKNTKAVPAAKLSIGVPFYGYGFGSLYQSDEISYCDIVTAHPGAENVDVYGTSPNAIWYNGIPTIKQKTTYALANAGGIMIWEIAEDCSGSKSLLLAIDQVVHPLPVTISSFTATPNAETVQLKWTTVNETDNSYFSVEHSTDGNTYESIAEVVGQGTTLSATDYAYVDHQPANGVNYYRLAQYDVNGTVNLSGALVVNMSNNKGYELYPNPFTHELWIKGNASLTAGHIQMRNLQGELIWEGDLAAGLAEAEIGKYLQYAGIYFVHVRNEQSLFSYKVSKE